MNSIVTLKGDVVIQSSGTQVQPALWLGFNAPS